MPYSPSDAYGKTHKANTPTRSRQWVHVYDSVKQRGGSDALAIKEANGTVRRSFIKAKAKRGKKSVPSSGE